MSYKKVYQFIAILLFITSAYAYSQESEQITLLIVTEEFKPYNFVENDELTGFSTEIIQLMIERAGFKAEFKVLPWARAYQQALEIENCLIYTIMRISDREDKFQWIAKLAVSEIVLYKKAGSNIKISNIENVAGFRVGVQTGALTNDYFLGNTDAVVVQVRTIDQRLLMLENGRIDLLQSTGLYIREALKDGTIQTGSIEPAFKIEDLKRSFYLAASLSTSPEIIEKLEAAFNEIVEDGSYDEIAEKYLIK